MDLKLLVEHFTLEEGCRLTSYRDHQGNWTIGIGHKLPSGKDYSNFKITQKQAQDTLIRDLEWAFDAAREIFPEYDSYPTKTQLGILDMIFNMGESRFRGFTNTIRLIRLREFNRASVEALNSDWARHDVPNRAARTAALLRG